MSNEGSSAQITPSAPTSFWETWVKALTKPRLETYAEIASSPKAKAITGYTWVFLGSVLSSLVAMIVQGATIRSRLSETGVDTGQLGGQVGAVVLTLVCGTPIVAVLATAFFAIGTALVQWIAKMFGGKGTNDQLAYTMAAISAPYAIISSVFMLLSAIPYVGFCFNGILGLAGIYILVLEVMAVKGVNRFGWGKAIGALFIPSLAVFLVCCCAIAAVAALTGMSLGNVFSTINQSLIQ